MKQWIKNKEQLGTTEQRKQLLEIIESGYEAINTESIIRKQVLLEGNTLKVKDHQFNLEGIDNIYVIGFGKVSCVAAGVLGEILGSNITDGVAIGLSPVSCEYIQTYSGTHPRPSIQNVEISEKIVELSQKITDRDLVIVIVSGGGSSLLCWPMEECKQANKLYEEFLPTGGNIKELNTVRKHISQLKGGGLAKKLYPATVVGLIFSDVPGDEYEYIASGPTYKDVTTIADAQAILDKYGLTGYELNETPNEDMYFEKVTNIALVSNIDAIDAMKNTAENLGLKTKVLGYDMYDSPKEIISKFLKFVEPGTVLLAGGEPQAIVTSSKGTGGRCQRVGLEMLPSLTEQDVFAAIASDGLDNGTAAGVIEDYSTKQLAEQKNIDLQKHLEDWDSQGFYDQTGNELLQTGPTHANVSDLIVMYRK